MGEKAEKVERADVVKEADAEAAGQVVVVAAEPERAVGVARDRAEEPLSPHLISKSTQRSVSPPSGGGCSLLYYGYSLLLYFF